VHRHARPVHVAADHPGLPHFLGNEAFEAWGWRIPFLVSILLLGVSVWIRLQLSESPLFQQMKSEGKGSKTPFRDSLKGGNLKLMLLVLLGAAAGQAVVWYGGQFYALFFLSSMLKVDATTSYLLIAAALALGVPFFIFFGWLSDRIGRKKIIMAGCLLAAVTYIPIFKGLTHFANPAIEEARSSSPAWSWPIRTPARSSSIRSACASSPAPATWLPLR
jgi:MFS family permease